MSVRRVDQGGLDHGIWTALKYLYPQADVPVLPLAWSPRESPAALFALGQSLAPLAGDGVLDRRHRQHHAQPAPGLRERHARRRAARDRREQSLSRLDGRAQRAPATGTALFDYRALAPHAVDMHPSDEHLLPWYIAAGAGGREAAPQRLHESMTFGALGMDTYAFGPAADELISSGP